MRAGVVAVRTVAVGDTTEWPWAQNAFGSAF